MTVQKAKRVVIKIGSALLVDNQTGQIRQNWLDAIADDIAECHKNGQEIIIVSSGAVAVGRNILSLDANRLRLEEKQAAAAAGQIKLAHAYQQTMDRHGIKIAQILLTLNDSEDRRRYLNSRNTVETLLKIGVIPVINENDTIATEEIRFGDNDRLAARVSQMLYADILVLFSDIDGMYTANPKTDENAEHIPVIDRITPEIEGRAGNSTGDYGTGGMITKVMAGRICMNAGCNMIIASGREKHCLKALIYGGKHTLFKALSEPVTARKRWIAGSLKAKGTIVIDKGAEKALANGKSLLPAGVVSVEGSFKRGDAVIFKNLEDKEIGKGLIAYSYEDASMIIGHSSNEIEKLLGYHGRQELVHRDDLVLEDNG